MVMSKKYVGLLLLLSSINYATPYRVISSLWHCRLPDFDARWATYVQQYVDLDDDHVSLHELYRRVMHCDTVHTFFSRLYINAQDQSLVYNAGEYSMMSNSDDLESVWRYWARTGNKAHHLFYARYFDWLARCFIAALYRVSTCRSSGEPCDELEDHARELHDRLHEIFVQVKGYCFEHCYARQLRRYQELLALV
jgi:hypothetical protein